MGHSGPGFRPGPPRVLFATLESSFGWRGQDSAALAISQAPPVDGLCVSICPLALGHVQDRAWIRPVFCSLPSVAREELRLPFERASSSWNTGIRLPTRGEVPSFEAVPPSLFSRKQHPASALSPPFGGSSFRWVGGSRTPFPPGGGICRWAVLPLRGRRRPALFGVVFLFSPAPSRGGLGTYGFPGLYGPVARPFGAGQWGRTHETRALTYSRKRGPLPSTLSPMGSRAGKERPGLYNSLQSAFRWSTSCADGFTFSPRCEGKFLAVAGLAGSGGGVGFPLSLVPLRSAVMVASSGSFITPLCESRTDFLCGTVNVVRSPAIQSHSLRINDFVGVVVSSGSVGGDGFPLLLVSSRSAVVVASADGGGNGGFPLYFAGSTGFDALGSFGSHYIIRSPDGHVLRPTFSIRCIITPAELLAPCLLGGFACPRVYALLCCAQGGGEGGSFPPSPLLAGVTGRRHLPPPRRLCADGSFAFLRVYALLRCGPQEAEGGSFLFFADSTWAGGVHLFHCSGALLLAPALPPWQPGQRDRRGHLPPAGFSTLAVREVMLGTPYMLSSRRGLHFLGGRRTLNGSFFL